MIRILFYLVISFSILIGSDLTAIKNGGISTREQVPTFTSKKPNIPQNNKFSNSENKEKSLAAKEKASELKKNMDTKLNIAKKLVSAKNKKKDRQISSSRSLNNSNFDPNSLHLKMKKKTPENIQSVESIQKRNILNTATDLKHKIYPELSKKASDPIITSEVRARMQSTFKQKTNLMPENIREFFTKEQIEAINIGDFGNNILEEHSREYIWLNYQQLEVDYITGDNQELTNRYFNENNDLVEEVHWYFDNYYQEWFLNYRLGYYYNEDGILDYYTYGWQLDENGFFVEDYHYLHFYNDDGSLSHVDIFYHGNENPELVYRYTYVFSQDAEGTVTDLLMFRYGWPASGGELSETPIMMDTYTYDENDNLVHELRQFDNSGEGVWENSSQYLMGHTDNLLQFRLLQFYDTYEGWIDDSVFEFEYDENDNINSRTFRSLYDGAPTEDPLSIRYYFWDLFETEEETEGVEFGFETVADLYATFGGVLNTYGADCLDCASMNDMSADVVGTADMDQGSITFFVNEREFQYIYFQFIDSNGNDQYDVEETYVLSLEDSQLGFSDHSISYSGDIYEMNFNRFWWLAYDFVFYEYPFPGEENLVIWNGYGFPFGWEMFAWGDAQLDTTIADGYNGGYYGYSTSALSYVQGGQWSGAGLDIIPPIDLHVHADYSSLKFWMWSEQDAPMLRIQFEDGLDRVGYNFIPEPMEGWHYYELPLSNFVFFDGSQTFDWAEVKIFQVMGEGNGEAGRTFHFSEIIINETQIEDEELYFDFVGDLNGHYYYVSQEPMSWHDGLNFTDTVNADGFVHMATINSEEEDVFLVNALQSFAPANERVWLGMTDEYEEGSWQWVTGEPVDYTNWADGQPDNSSGVEHYAELNYIYGDWNDNLYDAPNLVLLEFIPNNPPEEPSLEGVWKMGPFAGSLRVGPEPFSGDWWAISDQDVQLRACYFDDLYVFDEEGFHNDQGEETWLEWWQGMDPEGCGSPVYPHDGSSNPAGYAFNEENGTLTLNGVGSYLGLPKAVNGMELTSPDQAPNSVTYDVYMQDSPRMMTLVIEVGQGVFWTFDLVPAMHVETVYFVKEDYADVLDPDNWDHITPSVAITRGDNQGLYNPYLEDSYNGFGPSGTLWHLGPTSEANPMNYTDWVDAVGGQAANLPGQTLSMWCLEENIYFDVAFENWTAGNNGGGFSYWRTFSEPPEGPNLNVHFVWGLMGSDETGDGSLENPFATIGHAVNIMENDDMVAVGPGSYNENIVVTDKSGLLVSFSGSDSTFINGNGGQILNSHNGFWMIDGFTFTDGSADDGGAILTSNGGLMLGRSKFVGNSADHNGGALAIFNSSVIMDSVIFSGNNSVDNGGAIFIYNTEPSPDLQWIVSLNNVTMFQNTSEAQGAGLRVYGGNDGYTLVSLFNATVRNNSGYSYSGLSLSGNVQADIYESRFIGNQAQAYSAAGGFLSGAYFEMAHCVVAGNQANLGGGTANSGGLSVWDGSYGTFTNCTFTENSAEYGSALTVGGGSYASLESSIVWNNPGDNALAAVQWNDNGSNLDVYNSVVQNGEDGIYADDLSIVYQDGVLNIDPLFCDPENGDFSIDMNSGAITPWGEPMGALGFGCEGNIMASANILSIQDVPNDQGGRVYVTFEKSLFDTDGLGRTEMYTVERMDGGQWVGLTSVGAYASEIYVVEATTLADSTSEGDGMTTYRVVANMDEGNFESEPESGYSVDNIAPMMVTGLTANMSDGMVMLSWGHSEANDFSHYMVYYSTVADFIPSEETMIGTHSLPSFEHNVEELGDHYYVVSAVDVNENESEYSEEVNVTLLSLADIHGLPETFALHQNYPNPFNPSTTIRFDLPEAGNVSLVIYDMMGREVTTLVSSPIEAGYHFVQWDGSNSIGSSVAAGVYIYTIQAGKHRAINKMIYLK